jgi:hypothetical protein
VTSRSFKKGDSWLEAAQNELLCVRTHTPSDGWFRIELVPPIRLSTRSALAAPGAGGVFASGSVRLYRTIELPESS